MRSTRGAARAVLLLLSCCCGGLLGTEETEEQQQGVYPQETFNFGSNWEKYVRQMSAYGDRTSEMYYACHASMFQLQAALSPLGLGQVDSEVPPLANSTFLDIGCGSGIHSASAVFLGAPRVVSFDLQDASVQATKVMKEILFPFVRGTEWEVQQADILEEGTAEAVSADVVYSWGALHHTGRMWEAVRNACGAVPRPEDGGGVMFLALYAQEVVRDADYWIRIKRKYLAEDDDGRGQMEREYAWFLLKDAVLQGNKNPFGMIAENPLQRGMDFWTDVKDWLGGLPCEFSEARDVIRFVRQECGLVPAKVIPSTVTEFLFVTDPDDPKLAPSEDKLVGRWHRALRERIEIELRPPYTWLDFSADRRRLCFAVRLPLPAHLNATTVKFDLKEDGYDFGFGVEVEEERSLETLDSIFEDEELELRQQRREWIAKFGADGRTCEQPGRFFRQPWSLGGQAAAVVVFSTSDGSDPNKNGRRYSVHLEPGSGEAPPPPGSVTQELYSAADLQWTRHK